MAMLPDMLRRDRERWGMSVGEAGWRLGITRRAYVAIEDGERAPSSNEYEVPAGWGQAATAPCRHPPDHPGSRVASAGDVVRECGP